MCTIVNDVLDLSKIETGSLELEQVPVDLYALLRDLEEVHRLTALPKALEWSVEIDKSLRESKVNDIPVVFYGDGTRVRYKQFLFQNLLFLY